MTLEKHEDIAVEPKNQDQNGLINYLNSYVSDQKSKKTKSRKHSDDHLMEEDSCEEDDFDSD